MRVNCILKTDDEPIAWGDPPYTFYNLTLGNVYRVIGISADMFRIMDDKGEPVLFPPSIFEIVDPTYPEDWMVRKGADQETYAYSPQLGELGFFEAIFDDDRNAWRVLSAYLSKWSKNRD